MNIDLEKTVSENRFTIAVVFPIIGALMLISSAEGLLPEIISFNPYLILFGTAVMRLPLIAGLLPLMDKKSIAGVSLLVLFSYAVEFVGTTTGLPYGQFEYGISLGPMIAGNVPWGLPIFFIPLVVNSYLLATLLWPEKTRRLSIRIFSVLSILMLMDIVLDPAAVALGFWSYSDSFFYGVPLSNFAGWIFSGSVAILLIEFSFNHEKLVERLENCSFMLDDVVSFGFLWSFVNLYFGNLLPFLLSIVFIAALIKTERFDFRFLNKLNI